MWEEIAETFDGFTKEEFFVALKNIKARYENNIVRKDIKGGEIKRCYFMDLPECIIFDILVKVPPIYIYKNGRLVCRLWREIISRGDFISQNFIQTKAELLIGGPTSHSNNQYGQVKLMEMEGMQLDFKLLDFGLRRMGDVRSSCNGLLLVNHPKQKGVIQVMNLVTLAGSTLPSCPSGCPHKACGLALGYDSIKKEYKVVHIYADAFGFEIISLGCPGAIWKRISGPWRDLQERPFNFEVFSWNDPISVNGEVLHWYVASEKYIVSMDVREETCIKTYLPNIDKEIKRDRYTLVELGGYLSFVYICSDIQVDIWILDDFRGQLWSKKHSIKVELTNYMADKKSLPSTDCNSALPNFSKLVTVASTQDGEILILKHANSCLYMYHIRHRLMKKLRMNMKHPRRFIPHRSSLLHWSALSDIVVLRDLLRPLHDLQDSSTLCKYLESFYTLRKPVASTINTLAGALYKVFCASPDKARQEMRDACFDYLSLGGIFSTGPVALLSGLNPRPLSLVLHFFAVAVYGVGRLLIPFPSPKRMWLGARLLSGASGIIFPIIRAEGVRQMFFPATVPAYYRAPPLD